jgi:hypothetical protein
VWGASLSPEHHFFSSQIKLLGQNTVSGIVGILVGGGVALFALGFLITSVTVAILPVIFGQNYEGDVANDSLTAIRESIGLDEEPPDEDKQYPNRFLTVVFYEHVSLERGGLKLFDWLNRRWNIFIVSFNCFVALLFSLYLGLIFQLGQRYWNWNLFFSWYLPALLLALILFIDGKRARSENRAMVNFLARRGLLENGGTKTCLESFSDLTPSANAAASSDPR